MQLFLFAWMLMTICEIFTIGGFPLKDSVRIVSVCLAPEGQVLTSLVQGFTGAQLGMITATTWILMINGAVGYQALNDGSFFSILLTVVSAAMLFVGTGYIALDTGYNWTGYFNTAQIQQDPNRSYALYTLYLLAPAVFLFIYFVLESWLVLRILGEIKPMCKKQLESSKR